MSFIKAPLFAPLGQYLMESLSPAEIGQRNPAAEATKPLRPAVPILARSNNFDFIRLFAAVLVLFTHSGALTGSVKFDPLFVFSGGSFNCGALGVAVFFVASGFLIAGAWERDPNLLRFLANRGLRILPGLAVAVLVCVLVVGPLATTLPLREYFSRSRTWEFLGNAGIFRLNWDLPGCFMSNHYPEIVNGSLWTIPHEVVCYLGLALVGLVGLFSRQVVATFIFCILFSFHLLFCRDHGWFLPEHFLGLLPMNDLVRLGSLFAAGMVMASIRKTLSPRGDYASVAAACLAACCCLGCANEFLPLLLPYLVYYVAYSPTIPLRQFGRYGDFSYGAYLYAFPVQQLLALPTGALSRHPLSHFFAATVISVGLGAISWHAVEKHFLRMKSAALLSHPSVEIFSAPPRAGAWLLDLLGRWIRPPLLQGLTAIVLVTCGVAWIRTATEPPRRVDFSKPQKLRLEGGWYAHPAGDTGRWLRGKGAVFMKIDQNRTLRVLAYVPGNFSEVTALNLSINGVRLASIARPVSEDGWLVDVSAKVTGAIPARGLVGLEFIGEHQPAAGAADQRVLSGLIKDIWFE